MHEDYSSIMNKVHMLQVLNSLNFIKLMDIDVRNFAHTTMCIVKYKEI